jgi:hypothetical protein
VASRPCERQTHICKPCPCAFHGWDAEGLPDNPFRHRSLLALANGSRRAPPRSPRRECRGPGWGMAGSGRSGGLFLSSAVLLHGTKSHVNNRAGCRFERNRCRIFQQGLPGRLLFSWIPSVGNGNGEIEERANHFVGFGDSRLGGPPPMDFGKAFETGSRDGVRIESGA